MSSLFKRNNGVYYVAFYDPSRRPSRKTVSTRLTTKRDAENVQRQLDAGYELGTFCPWKMGARDFLRPETPAERGPDLSRFGLAADAFLASRANLRPMTRERYRSIVSRFAVHYGRGNETAAVTTGDVQAFIDSTETKPVTAHNYRKAISTLFRWLEEEGIREGDPTRGVRLPRAPQKHPRFLRPTEVEAICTAIEEASGQGHAAEDTGLWLLPIVRANVYLGLRAGEVVNLRWEDVDLVRGTVAVRQSEGFTTKAGKDRALPVASPVARVLSGLERRSEFVFPNYSGTQLHRQYLSRRFKHFVREAKLPEVINFHSTRHTAASWLAERGASIEAIRLYLGHSSVRVTERYMHLAPDAYANEIHAALSA